MEKMLPDEVTKFLRKWGEIKINGKSLGNSLIYDNIKLWDVIEYNFASLLFEVEAVRLGEKKKKGTKERIEPILRKHLNNLKQKQRRSKSHGATRKNKIIFIVPIETGVPVISPVIKKMEKDGECELKIIRFGSLRERVKKNLESEGIQSVPIEAYTSKESDKQIKKFQKQLKKTWEELKNGNFAKEISYKKMNVWDSVKFSFEYYFHTRKWVLEVVKYIEYLKNIIHEENPSLIVMVDECSEFAKATGIIAKRNNVPSLGIQHGFFGETNLIYGPTHYDKIAVWGNYTKEIMAKRAIPKEKMVVTGCPKFDSLLSYMQKDPKKIRKKHGLDEKKKIITYVGRGILEKENQEMLSELFKLVGKLPGYQLVIKMHPRIYNKSFYLNLAQKANNQEIFVRRDINLYDLLAASEILIMTSSTVGLEATILNIPVIVINSPEISSVFKTTPFILVNNSQELEKWIKKLVSGKSLESLKKTQSKFRYNYAYKIDGRSTKRVVNLIDNMIRL